MLTKGLKSNSHLAAVSYKILKCLVKNSSPIVPITTDTPKSYALKHTKD